MAVLLKPALLERLPGPVQAAVIACHRLTAKRRLLNKEQARKFVHERGIVTLFAGTELPSIQEALVGMPITNKGNERFGPGFGIAWIWGKDMPEGGQCAYGSFFREKATLVARRLWPVLGVLGTFDYRRAHKSGRLSAPACRMAAYIEEHGPTRSDVLRSTLGYENRAGSMKFQRARRELERLWTIITVKHGEHIGGADVNTWELTARWMPDEVKEEARQLTRPEAGARFVLAGVESALVVEERGISRWFGWTAACTAKAVDRLLRSGRLHRIEGERPLLVAGTARQAWET